MASAETVALVDTATELDTTVNDPSNGGRGRCDDRLRDRAERPVERGQDNARRRAPAPLRRRWRVLVRVRDGRLLRQDPVRLGHCGVVLEIVDGAFHMRIGPIGRQVLVAWRGAVGSAARAGLNVIADDVVLTEEEWHQWQIELDGLDTHWVRVQIALDLAEVRERARANRMPGHARAQYDDAYRYPIYDAEVDSGELDPDAAAAVVHAGWHARTT
jgi:chloramphenicol 3-O-phosphotransferase